MARSRLCKVCGDWHDMDAPWPEACVREASAQAFHVIRDEIDPLRSGADGKVYTSKSAMRKSYRPSGNPQGLSFIEVGNEPMRQERPQPKSDPAAVRASLQKAMARYSNGERVRH